MGLLVFDRSGSVIQFLTKPELPKFAMPNRLKGTDKEYREVMQSILSGFGAYTVDGETVTIKWEASSYPNRAGTTERRTYKLVGEELTAMNPTAASGGTSCSGVGTSQVVALRAIMVIAHERDACDRVSPGVVRPRFLRWYADGGRGFAPAPCESATGGVEACDATATRTGSLRKRASERRCPMKTKIVIGLMCVAALLAWTGMAGAQAAPPAESATAERRNRVGSERRLGCVDRELRSKRGGWNVSQCVSHHADRQCVYRDSIEGHPATLFWTSGDSKSARRTRQGWVQAS